MSGRVAVSGYAPGALGWVIAEHGRYYAREWQFPAAFECRVGTELCMLLANFNAQRDGFWLASIDEAIAGSIAIDGSSDPLWPRLRFFILSAAHRGRGIGSALMRTALEFCRSAGHRRVYLTTFAGLDAARHLYEKFGFALVDEHEDTTWGPRTLEQRFELHLH